MKYQLVLQFHAKGVHEFDELVAMENLLIAKLPASSEVDGHDFGNGELNIFLFTDQPQQAFLAVKEVIQHKRPEREFKAAYRQVGHDSFVTLWPEGLRKFKIA